MHAVLLECSEDDGPAEVLARLRERWRWVDPESVNDAAELRAMLRAAQAALAAGGAPAGGAVGSGIVGPAGSGAAKPAGRARRKC